MTKKSTTTSKKSPKLATTKKAVKPKKVKHVPADEMLADDGFYEIQEDEPKQLSMLQMIKLILGIK